MAKIKVRVQTRASNQKIVRNQDGRLKIYLRNPAHEGRANKEMIELLSQEFNLPKSSVRIVSGHTSKNKLIELS